MDEIDAIRKYGSPVPHTVTLAGAGFVVVLPYNPYRTVIWWPQPTQFNVMPGETQPTTGQSASQGSVGPFVVTFQLHYQMVQWQWWMEASIGGVTVTFWECLAYPEASQDKRVNWYGKTFPLPAANGGRGGDKYRVTPGQSTASYRDYLRSGSRANLNRNRH